MADTKKFYWIKLKTNFFSREDIDFLLSQKNGAEYVVLYQMLCLNTANNDGRLESKIGEMIVPYNADKIVRDCKYFDIDTVNIAMAIYKRLGLIYEEEDSVLKISNYDEMVGSETAWAEKKRLYRKNQKLLNCVDNVEDNVEDNVRQENRDKSIDNRDIDNRDIDNREKNNNYAIKFPPEPSKKELLKQYDSEFEKLWEHYPNKKGKEQARNKFISARKDGTPFEEIATGLKNYILFIKAEKMDSKYIKHGSTWFNQKCWNDDYSIKEDSKQSKKDSQMEILKGVYNGTTKIS